MISQLLEFSNCETGYLLRFTRYQMERITSHGIDRTGCSSKNFLQAGAVRALYGKQLYREKLSLQGWSCCRSAEREVWAKRELIR